jgi:hypothetical protein
MADRWRQVRLVRTVSGVSDDFSGRYGDLLAGSYDCVDRIVLKAYFPLGHSPAGSGSGGGGGTTVPMTSWTTRA